MKLNLMIAGKVHIAISENGYDQGRDDGEQSVGNRMRLYR